VLVKKLESCVQAATYQYLSIKFGYDIDYPLVNLTD